MDNKLYKIVLEKISEKGKITFAEFMDMALFYPSLGYYQKENPFGTTGSFYTSVNSSEKFGFALAKSFIYFFNTLDIDYKICEMGAGSGMLANDILNYLKSKHPEIYQKTTYTIIEKSEYLI
ncbi:MAG: SAM-dependent methyltransferase, partial [Calditerrivibrio sp.]|nr:SAM-dependent methyltransferase [Calditerrivibrio sp.]